MARYICKGCKEAIVERGRLPISGNCKPCRDGVSGGFISSNTEAKVKLEFSLLEYNRGQVKFYREVFDEIERMNENLAGDVHFLDLLDKELKRKEGR